MRSQIVDKSLQLLSKNFIFWRLRSPTLNLTNHLRLFELILQTKDLSQKHSAYMLLLGLYNRFEKKYYKILSQFIF